MSTLYISPTGAGAGNGSDWANAANLSQLSALISRAGPGGTVLLRADQGAYTINAPVILTAGGYDGQLVTIRGADASGADMDAQFVGTRNIAKGVAGSEVFRLMGGADNLDFEHLAFTNVGNGAFRIGADIRNLAIQHVDAHNVQRFIEDFVSGGNTSASVSGLLVQDVEVHGYSKGAIRLQYDSHNILIQDVLGDSEKQSQDNFAMGVALDGSAHDVIFRRVVMANSYNDMSAYWNGDGFATEAGVYRVLFENTQALGNTDGGYDLKSSDTTLIGAYAAGNKRNYRFWGDGVRMDNSVGVDPHKTGGTGDQTQVWLADRAHTTITNSTFLTGAGSNIFELSPNAHLTLFGDTADASSGAVYSKAEAGATITTLTEVLGLPALPLVSVSAPVAAAVALDNAVYGSAGPDLMTGGDGADTLRAMDGDDQVSGAGGMDDVNGNVGADIVHGGDGADTVRGGKDNDLVFGDEGDDPHVNGNIGADTVSGGPGNDTVYGGQDGDILNGDAGDDWLSGDLGNDLLFGGPGADRFLFRPGSGADWVGDFNAAEGDRIQLPVGTAYAVADYAGQAVIALATGDTIGLAGTPFASFSADWVVYA